MVEQKYCDKCKRKGDFDVCAECHRGSKYEKKSISWGDKIRSMTDEELAELLIRQHACEHCEYHDRNATCKAPSGFICTNLYAEGLMLKWLKSEAKE